MANTFRSKEVYKKLRKEVHNRHTMVAVEGVYVSGEYRPPYYANMGVTITDIQCNKASVVSYEDDILDIRDDFSYGLMNVIDVTDWHIEEYTSSLVSSYDDFSYGLMNVNHFTDWDIHPYGNDHDSVYDDFSYGMLDVVIVTEPEIICYYTENNNMTPEPILRITQINSTKAEITNVT